MGEKGSSLTSGGEKMTRFFNDATVGFLSTRQGYQSSVT
jgi:hypothetical protein